MVEEAELRLFSELPAKLHPGEASSLVIAQRRGWLLLTDDLAARTQAKQRGVRLSGSLGELVLAVKHQQCSLEQANQWLKRMIELNYRSPVNDLTALLQ
jgi:predicted nucleic acid-binding protein